MVRPRGEIDHGRFQEEAGEGAYACEVGAEETVAQEVPEEGDETNEESFVGQEGGAALVGPT
jgi:hypothetical protein